MGRRKLDAGTKAHRKKKHPDAPRRCKSPYMFFTMERRQFFLDQLGPGANKVTDVAKLSAAAWKTMTPAQKFKYEEMGRLDRERYKTEKAAYTGPLQMNSRRSNGGGGHGKDADAPKRPMSAFLFFSQEARPALKASRPDLNHTGVVKELGRLWREMSEEQRRPYVEHEAEKRRIYKVNIAEYNASRHEREAEEKEKQKAEGKALKKATKKAKATKAAADGSPPRKGPGRPRKVVPPPEPEDEYEPQPPPQPAAAAASRPEAAAAANAFGDIYAAAAAAQQQEQGQLAGYHDQYPSQQPSYQQQLEQASRQQQLEQASRQQQLEQASRQQQLEQASRQQQLEQASRQQQLEQASRQQQQQLEASRLAESTRALESSRLAESTRLAESSRLAESQRALESSGMYGGGGFSGQAASQWGLTQQQQAQLNPYLQGSGLGQTASQLGGYSSMLYGAGYNPSQGTGESGLGSAYGSQLGGYYPGA